MYTMDSLCCDIRLVCSIYNFVTTNFTVEVQRERVTEKNLKRYRANITISFINCMKLKQCTIMDFTAFELKSVAGMTAWPLLRTVIIDRYHRRNGNLCMPYIFIATFLTMFTRSVLSYVSASWVPHIFQTKSLIRIYFLYVYTPLKVLAVW